MNFWNWEREREIGQLFFRLLRKYSFWLFSELLLSMTLSLHTAIKTKVRNFELTHEFLLLTQALPRSLSVLEGITANCLLFTFKFYPHTHTHTQNLRKELALKLGENSCLLSWGMTNLSFKTFSNTAVSENWIFHEITTHRRVSNDAKGIPVFTFSDTSLASMYQQI